MQLLTMGKWSTFAQTKLMASATQLFCAKRNSYSSELNGEIESNETRLRYT